MWSHPSYSKAPAASNRFPWKTALILLFCTTSAPLIASAQNWSLARPSNTGIPGEEIRCLAFAPDGKLWVGARWIFWQEGGFGIYDRSTDLWTTYADFETPIPSEYVNDIAFAPNGVIWIATDGGLVRKQGSSWTVYTTNNAPLLHNFVREVEVDSQGHVWLNNTNVQNQSCALFEFDGTTWRSFAVPVIPFQDPWRQLQGLVVDRQDHVWIGNMTLPGVAEYNGQTWVLRGQNIDLLKPEVADASNGIWMITGNLGYQVYRWNGTSFVLFGGSNPPLATTTITQVTTSPSGAVYIGNWMGQVVRSFDLGAHWSSFATVTARVTGITFPSDETEVWIGSEGAVHRYTSGGALQHVYNTWNTGMPDFWVDRFNTDPAGNLWMATG